MEEEISKRNEAIVNAFFQAGYFADINAPSIIPSLPKPNCKKGHNYQLIKGEEKSGIRIDKWQCRCGKVL
jgi:hypothetical protein